MAPQRSGAGATPWRSPRGSGSGTLVGAAAVALGALSLGPRLADCSRAPYAGVAEVPSALLGLDAELGLEARPVPGGEGPLSATPPRTRLGSVDAPPTKPPTPQRRHGRSPSLGRGAGHRSDSHSSLEPEAEARRRGVESVATGGPFPGGNFTAMARNGSAAGAELPASLPKEVQACNPAATVSALAVAMGSRSHSAGRTAQAAEDQSPRQGIAGEVGTDDDRYCVQTAQGLYGWIVRKHGCEAHCQCGWFEHCYPKHIAIKDPEMCSSEERKLWKKGTAIDIGVCGLSVTSMYVLSGLLFLYLIGALVTVRMLCQWQDDPNQGKVEDRRLPRKRPVPYDARISGGRRQMTANVATVGVPPRSLSSSFTSSGGSEGCHDLGVTPVM